MRLWPLRALIVSTLAASGGCTTRELAPERPAEAFVPRAVENLSADAASNIVRRRPAELGRPK